MKACEVKEIGFPQSIIGASVATTEFEACSIAVQRSKNPLLRAARPLLRALAEMPKYLEADAVVDLRSLLERELRTFQKLCERANLRRDHMIGARYCLCTALDEAAMQTTWGKGGSAGVEWNTNGLASAFHEDREGGNKVYLLIGRLLAEPHEHIDLLEVIYRIQSLGFEGRYRYETGGSRKHLVIRQRLYNEIMSHRGTVPVALSPHWHSNAKGKRPSFSDLPVWITLTALSAILLGMFGWYKYQLLGRSAEVQQQIAEIGSKLPPQHAAPAVPATPSIHLKQLLKHEIAAGTVSVDEDASRSTVTFRGDAMFETGGAAVRASMEPLVEKIAREIAKARGKVTVLGYTDNIPMRSARFASNGALSKERASQVMQVLQTAGVATNRLEAVGRGDADPIGDNGTVQGRALNRRVEIVVTRQ